MKKILKLFVLVLLIILTNSNIVSAKITKNFYGYQVKNVNIRQLVFEINSAIEAYKGDDKFVPIENIKNAYIY